MVSHTLGNMQLLAFTHRLIDRGFHTDERTYRALCAAYTTLLATRATDDDTLARLFDRVCVTPETLLADIQAMAAHAQGIQ